MSELKKFDQKLYEKPRWLVLNKLDMVPADEREALVKDIVKRLKFKGPVFEISALTREGCERLVQSVYEYLAKEFRSHLPEEKPDPRFVDPILAASDLHALSCNPFFPCPLMSDVVTDASLISSV